MEEKSQYAGRRAAESGRAFFFLSPLSELVLLTGPLCWTWDSLVDTHSLSHTVESAQPGTGSRGD